MPLYSILRMIRMTNIVRPVVLLPLERKVCSLAATTDPKRLPRGRSPFCLVASDLTLA
jgi:hypothetical protein